ncbi:MAG: gamma-glutamyl-gamma-aminobutyrate hydrolase family protein [Hyphomicrobium sp.]|jgi:putative glutamine amidotransferase
MKNKPLVGVICCTRFPEDPAQAVAERYLRAVPFMGAEAVLLPSMPGLNDPASIISRVDGVLLTGSPSNVEPSRYRTVDPGAVPFDPPRDDTAMGLISTAVDAGKPVLGICRGFQEIAVKYGATLRRDLGDDQREQVHHVPHGIPINELFDLSHRVDLTQGGVLETALGCPSIVVNSAHFQGVRELGPDLVVEATSPDGIIEAVRPKSGDRVLGVQWHPEWKVAENDNSRALFALFGLMLRGESLQGAAEAVARRSS